MVYGVTTFPPLGGSSLMILTSFERKEINWSTSKISVKLLQQTPDYIKFTDYINFPQITPKGYSNLLKTTPMKQSQ